MNLIRYEPWAAVRRAQRSFDHLLDDSIFGADRGLENRAHWVPAVDVREQGNAFVVTADLPGLEPGDIEISAENGQLLLRGERDSKNEEEGEGYRRTERLSGKFERRFELPDTADTDAITATSANGVLTITIPKKAQLQPRRIEIDVA